MVAECLAVPLTSIINNCIAKAYFPKQWKIARVSPVPKIDNPVSNDQLHAHLLHDRISAFRKGHSTITALLRVRDDVRYAMKRKEVTLMVLSDFSKAFDTIPFSAT